MVVPLIGSQMVPARIRLMLTIAITVVVVPVLPAMPEVDALSLNAFVLIAQQILIGVLLGFFLQLCFHVFILVGQMIAMQMGLGFASMIDPTNGVSVAIVSSIYLMFVSLLFVTLNGHLVMIDVLVQSFSTMPVSLSFSFADSGLLQIVDVISWVFSSAMLIALPALTALLITNLGFGIMTRAAPQMNIFALGFPVALLLGLGLLWYTLGTVSDAAEAHFLESFVQMRNWIGDY